MMGECFNCDGTGTLRRISGAEVGCHKCEGTGRDPGKPEWTTTPPTEPGWYFFRMFRDSIPEPVSIPVHPDEEIEYQDGEWWPERIKEPNADS